MRVILLQVFKYLAIPSSLCYNVISYPQSLMETTFEENTQAQMRKGTLEFCILLIIARGKVYASEILNQLTEAELLVVEGTLYPLLARLRTGGLVSYEWVESSGGPPRKYYSLTDEGKATLEHLTLSWKKMYRSINTLLKNTS